MAHSQADKSINRYSIPLWRFPWFIIAILIFMIAPAYGGTTASNRGASHPQWRNLALGIM